MSRQPAAAASTSTARPTTREKQLGLSIEPKHSKTNLPFLDKFFYLIGREVVVHGMEPVRTGDLRDRYIQYVRWWTEDNVLIELAEKPKRFFDQFRAMALERGYAPVGHPFRGYEMCLPRVSRGATERSSLWVSTPPKVVYINAVKGHGCFATSDYLKGQIVCEYLGELITRDEMLVRDAAYQQQGLYHIIIDLSHNLYLDGNRLADGTELSVKDIIGASLNHSNVSPNCDLVKDRASGRYVIKLITAVSANAELTWCYDRATRQHADWFSNT